MCVISCRSSSPGQVLIPIANWKVKEPPVIGDDIGPQIVHVYEVVTASSRIIKYSCRVDCTERVSVTFMSPPPQLLNSGPSTVSKAALRVDWPYQFRNGSLLYITSYETEGPINCTTDMEINSLNISVRNTHTHTGNNNNNTLAWILQSH